MESILSQLYGGEIFPAEQIFPRDAEYRPICKRVEEERTWLKEKLNQEDGERLDGLHDDYFELSYMSDLASFSSGFRLAALLMCEVFTGEEVKRGEEKK